MARWIGPVIVALLLGAGAGYVTLLAAPRVLMAMAITRISANGGVNRMTHAPLATSESRAIVRPSPDLAYSSCPFDVSEGPVIVTVAPVPSPYWSIAVFEGDTDAVFVRNNVQANGRPVRVAILGEGQVAPAGASAVRVAGDRGVALLRVLVPDRVGFARLDAARRQAACGRP